MLRRLACHLQPGGHLFLMLPTACLKSSPCMSQGLFVRLLKDVGFDVLPESKENPKITFYCCKLSERQPGKAGKAEEKSRRWCSAPPLELHTKDKRRKYAYRSDFAACFPADDDERNAWMTKEQKRLFLR